MKKLYLLLISLLLLSNVSLAQCGIYTEAISQKIDKIRFWDDMNGFAFGGAKLMTTNDGGETWRDFQLPDYESLLDSPMISTQIIDETSAIIVGYNGHILYTNDKGVNWNYQSVRYDGRERLSTVNFVDDKIGYIGGVSFDETELIIFKTIDAGLNWKKIPTTLSIHKLEFITAESAIFNFHFFDESTGFLWKRSKLFKTIDGGITWLQQPALPQSDNNNSIVSIKNGPENTVYLSKNSSQGIQVYKTTNFGESWTIINEVEGINNNLITGRFDIRNNFLYAEVYTDVYYKRELLQLNLTTNQVVRTPLNDDLGTISDIYFYENTKAVLVATSPLDGPNSGRIILKTQDSGSTYSTLDSFNVKSNNVTNLKILPNENNVFTAAVIDQYNTADFTDRALYLHISKDNGNSWKQIAKTEKKFGALLYAKNSKIIYYTYEPLADFTLAFFRIESDDYGASWQEMLIPVPYIPNDMNPIITAIDEHTFLYANYVSTDKGQTWTDLQIPIIENTSFNSTKIVSIDEIYIWGYSQTHGFVVYKSQNQGQSWTNIITIPGNEGPSVAFGSNFILLHDGYDNYFKVNLSEGTYQTLQFTNPLNQPNIYVPYISFISDTYWLISEYFIFFNIVHSTQDQGQTWTTKLCFICSNNFIYNEIKDELLSYGSQNFNIGRLTPYFPKTPTIFGNTMTKINSIEEYFIPIDVYASSTWELISGGEIISDENTNSYKIKVKWSQSGENILRVKRTNNCGESEYSSIKVSVLPENSKEILDTATAFPNPFSDKITIQFRQTFKSFRAELYNILGVKVLGTATTIEANKVSLENIGHLSSGVYFIKISDNESDKYQMIKVLKE